MSNYYEEQQIGTIERAVLAEAVNLPAVTTEPLTLSFLEGGGEYKIATNEYKDITGKFFLNIMTPLVDKGSASKRGESAPSTRGHCGDSLTTTNYSSSNYISLVIPKYILLNFIGSIPKGTEFIVASIGGSVEIEDMRIIGIYSSNVNPELEG